MKLLCKSSLLAVWAMVFLGCTSERPARVITLSPGQSNWLLQSQSQAALNEIREAVLRHMFKPDSSEKEISHSLNQVHKVYFVELDDERQSNATFLSRFRDVRVPVKPHTAGEWKDFFIYDKQTGLLGAYFAIRNIHHLEDNTVEVECVLHPGGGLSASGPIYRLNKVNGHWQVVEERLKWIS